MITFDQFKEVVIQTKNSIDPKINLSDTTIKMWFESYFRYYSLEQIQKVFRSIAEEGKPWALQTFLNESKSWWGYLMHEEVEYCWGIMDKAEKEGKKVKPNSYPKLEKEYKLPRAWAWEVAFNMRQK